jgi:hypothetical protein
MVVAVMGSAQRHRELVAHLASHCAQLGEPQMVGVGGYARERVRSDKTVRERLRQTVQACLVLTVISVDIGPFDIATFLGFVLPK